MAWLNYSLHCHHWFALHPHSPLVQGLGSQILFALIFVSVAQWPARADGGQGWPGEGWQRRRRCCHPTHSLTLDIRWKLCQCRALSRLVLSLDRGTQPYDLYYAFSLLDEISRNKESGQRRNRPDILKGILCGKRERNARKLERERDSRLVRTKDPVCVVTWGRGLVLHNGDQARPGRSHYTLHIPRHFPRPGPVSG